MGPSPVLSALALLLATAGAACAAPADPGRGGGSQDDPIRVLVITATHGFRHDASIEASQRVLQALQARTELRFDFTEELSTLNPQNLAGYDVVFLNNATLRVSGVPRPLSASEQEALASFVRGGKGLMTIHSGVDANYGWAEYREMVGGGLFQSHPHVRSATVRLEDPTHPGVVHFGGSSFTIREEFYYLDANPRANARVLASLDMASVGGDPAEDHPLIFVRRHGQGRVFVSVLGHFADNWEREDFQTHVAQGLRIAAGRVAADFTPRPR